LSEGKSSRAVDRDVDGQKNGATTVQRYRLLLLILMLLGLWLTAWATGVHRLFDGAAVRALVAEAGVWSLAVFVLAFSVGQLLRIPGPVFVATAILAYGRALGTVAAMVGALVSVTVSFIGSISKVEMTTPMALICKALFPSISTFETPP